MTLEKLYASKIKSVRIFQVTAATLLDCNGAPTKLIMVDFVCFFLEDALTATAHQDYVLRTSCEISEKDFSGDIGAELENLLYEQVGIVYAQS